MNNPLSRREFIQTSALLMGTHTLAAKNETTPPHHGAIVGHGKFQYRVDKLWCKADREKNPVKDCHEMVESRDGRLFLITNLKQNNVLTFNPDGELVDAWSLGLGGGHGLSIHLEDQTEYLYLTDTSGRVIKTTLEGKLVLELPHATKCGAYAEKEPYSPTETAIAPNGDIYVADGYGSQFILRFDRNGTFLDKFGGKSTQPTNPGKFMQAHGVAIDLRGPQPLLVCTERVRNEFNWFTLEGTFVRGVYLPGAYVSRPVIHGNELYSGVCFGAKQDDYRMWQGRGFVTILDENNKVVSNPGGQPPRYEEGRLKPMLQDLPVFNNCHDVCVDSKGDLYVCQWNSGNVYPYKLHRIT